jgi:hypothetical protein
MCLIVRPASSVDSFLTLPKIVLVGLPRDGQSRLKSRGDTGSMSIARLLSSALPSGAHVLLLSEQLCQSSISNDIMPA